MTKDKRIKFNLMLNFCFPVAFPCLSFLPLFPYMLFCILFLYKLSFSIVSDDEGSQFTLSKMYQ
jgi:hypothetical protein